MAVDRHGREVRPFDTVAHRAGVAAVLDVRNPFEIEIKIAGGRNDGETLTVDPTHTELIGRRCM